MDKNSNENETKNLREMWGTKVQAVHRWTKEKFDSECKKYIEMLRHEFGGAVPSRLLSDRVDVNIVFQTIKSLLPSLYFKNPKVYLKPLQEKIVTPIRELMTLEDGSEIENIVMDAMGSPLTQEFDAPKAALKLQAAINENIQRADLKYNIKMALQDALLCFYGAIKCGWGNDQGVASMGEDGAPPSMREEVYEDLAYAIRLKPWDVVVDPEDFYAPKWIALRYSVDPEQLRQDKRLQNTDKIKGSVALSDQRMKDVFAGHPDKETLMAEYFEIYIKPCAKYPEGKFFMLCPEVKDSFLYESNWPVKSKTFPIKLLYFNPDPEGGLPTPDMRYLAGHQKAKLNLRNTEYEYVQRTLPMLLLNTSAVKDPERLLKQIQSGQFPRVLTGNQQPGRIAGGVSFPSLPIDFRNMDGNIDSDIARVMGLTSPVTPTTNQDQLATGLKLAASGEAVRQNERADVVSDFVQSILEFWVDLYKEFAGPENYSLVDGEPFPIKWTREEIQGRFLLEVQPFSMSYEDPVIRRRQYTDILNLLASPELQMQLKQQGASVNLIKIVKRVLETYDEKDVETFVITDDQTPENQVLHAMQENEMIISGQGDQVAVMPTDNHRVHILLHSLLNEHGSKHILEHNQALGAGVLPGGPGGGNPEGMPINGVAADQEMMTEPIAPSPQNSLNAISHQANATTDTR